MQFTNIQLYIIENDNYKNFENCYKWLVIKYNKNTGNMSLLYDSDNRDKAALYMIAYEDCLNNLYVSFHNIEKGRRG